MNYFYKKINGKEKLRKKYYFIDYKPQDNSMNFKPMKMKTRDLRLIHRSMKYKFVLELPLEFQTMCFCKLIINATSLKFGIYYQCLIGLSLCWSVNHWLEVKVKYGSIISIKLMCWWTRVKSFHCQFKNLVYNSKFYRL